MLLNHTVNTDKLQSGLANIVYNMIADRLVHTKEDDESILSMGMLPSHYLNQLRPVIENVFDKNMKSRGVMVYDNYTSNKQAFTSLINRAIYTGVRQAYDAGLI